jgi:hypothetical protein
MKSGSLNFVHPSGLAVTRELYLFTSKDPLRIL